jgi:hypothetical protein
MVNEMPKMKFKKEIDIDKKLLDDWETEVWRRSRSLSESSQVWKYYHSILKDAIRLGFDAELKHVCLEACHVSMFGSKIRRSLFNG